MAVVTALEHIRLEVAHLVIVKAGINDAGIVLRCQKAADIG